MTDGIHPPAAQSTTSAAPQCQCASQARQSVAETPSDKSRLPGARVLGARSVLVRYVALLLFGLAAWVLVYLGLKPFSRWLAFDVLRLSEASRLGSGVQFFVYDTPKVLMLLVLIVFFVGIVRTFFTPQTTRRLLAGKRESVGNILAAGLGVVTPFCSCSAVPLFIGFVTAGVPLGVTFSFLIAAPMVNEVALVLLYGLFGWQVAMLYLATGLFIAMLAGWVIGRLKLEGHVEEWVYQTQVGEAADVKLNWAARLQAAWQAAKDIVKKVWPFIVLGIAIGAVIHGYVPENFMASIMGKSAWWSVPAAVLIGVPMYSNAAGMIPVVQALLGKGAALGTALAFMMAVIALSLPEILILRRVLKPRLIAIFVTVVALGILLVGYVFNAFDWGFTLPQPTSL
ncbi:MAG: permease [Thermoleophilia bacterium]|nr:permease [Thermoleophilia bacterium]